MRLLTLFFALFLAATPVFAQEQMAPSPAINSAAQQGAAKRVFLRLHADRDAAVPGATLRLAIEQLIVPGWHTYWTNPGDSGEPMKIKWDLPQGYAVSDLLWPTPDHVPYGPLMNFGYSDQAVMLADLTVPADAKAGSTVSVRGRANVLVCDEICIPEQHDIALDLKVAAKSRPANSDIFTAAGARLPQPVDWQTVTDLDGTDVRVRVSLPASASRLAAGEDGDIEFFPLEWGYLENAADQTAEYEATSGTLTLRQARIHDRDMSAVDTAGYVIKMGQNAWVVSGPVTGAAAPVMGAAPVDGANAGILTLLLFALLGGAILNLMPCVFPILSMKALHLVSMPHHERRHAQKTALLYAAGIITMFLALAAALIALRAGGQQLGWGFQLQNPAFVAALAWLVFVVGLNLAGMFNLRIAFGGEMLLAEKHHPLLSAFLSGVLATLVATPCSAPFMATAVGAAMTQSTPVALMIFAFLGLGLAAPFLLLAFVPGVQKFLPRPGAWMETFRQLLAFPMFASAVWLVWVIDRQGGSAAVAWTLAGAVLIAFAIWLAGRQPVGRAARTLTRAFSIVIILLTLGGLSFIHTAPAATADAVSAEAVKVQPFTTDALETALKESDDPVFVNMTASWCITCLVNERVVLSTPETQALFRDNNVTYLKGDWTNRDPQITDYLQKFGRSGVPIYVFYGAPGDDGTRPAPVVLPQILSADIIETLFEEEQQ